MKHSQVSLLFSLLLTVGANGQQYTANHTDIRLLNAGTSTWPIKLAKRWFEGDTIYIITFRDARHNITGETGSQGFYKFELKEFGKALNTTLTIDSTQEVSFGKGTMSVGNGAFRVRYIECTFSSRTGTLCARDADVKKLIHVINKQ